MSSLSTEGRIFVAILTELLYTFNSLVYFITTIPNLDEVTFNDVITRRNFCDLRLRNHIFTQNWIKTLKRERGIINFNIRRPQK